MHPHPRSGLRRAGPTPSTRRSRLLVGARLIALVTTVTLAGCGLSGNSEASRPGPERASAPVISPVTSSTLDQVSADTASAGLGGGNAVSMLDRFGSTGSDNTAGTGAPAPQDGDGASTSTTITTTAPVFAEAKAAIENVRADLAAAGSPSAGTELLDAVEPLDHGPGAGEAQNLREGSRLNEAGEQNTFDEAASLACAGVEIALTALDEGRAFDAAENVGSAATRAAESRVVTIDQWHLILRDTSIRLASEDPSDVAPLLAFLSTCTQGGYEL